MLRTRIGNLPAPTRCVVIPTSCAKTNPISIRPPEVVHLGSRESHVPASKKKSGGTSDCRASVVQPESNRCQSAHQNNILCHLPLPVAMSSRRSRTKLSPPRKLHGQFASPRHPGRWGPPDSRRRRLCRGEHACELPAARAEGAASVSVHRRPTPNRCQGHRANVRSEPTTERPARRCAELTYPGGTAFCTLHPRWEPRSLPADSCNHHIRSLTTSSTMAGSRRRLNQS